MQIRQEKQLQASADVTPTRVPHIVMWVVIGKYGLARLGISQHAEFIFDVRFAA